MMVELTEAEKMAVNTFLGEHWAAFCKKAKEFLTEDEIDALAEKIEK